MRKTKTLLASENFVDIFSLLSRWQLDPAIISCRQFGYIVSTMMDAVCLREFHAVDFVALNESTIEVKWHFTVNGEVDEAVAMLTHHRKETEAIMRLASRIRSSAVECITFWRMIFADEWLAEIIEAMDSVHVNQLVLIGCDFSSASEGLVRSLISTFTSLRDLTSSTCVVVPSQYTNELLYDCARRPELTRLHLDVKLPFDYFSNDAAENVAPLDDGILYLLFREVGQGVDVTFQWAFVSDTFSKRLLEVSH